MEILPGHDARETPLQGQPWLRFDLRTVALPNSMGTLHDQMAKSYKPLTSKSFQSQSKRPRRYSKARQVPGAAGRKRHGSHRSQIIGKYQFTTSPVVSLHQAGVIWNAV